MLSNVFHSLLLFTETEVAFALLNQAVPVKNNYSFRITNNRSTSVIWLLVWSHCMKRRGRYVPKIEVILRVDSNALSIRSDTTKIFNVVTISNFGLISRTRVLLGCLCCCSVFGFVLENIHKSTHGLWRRMGRRMMSQVFGWTFEIGRRRELSWRVRDVHAVLDEIDSVSLFFSLFF